MRSRDAAGNGRWRRERRLRWAAALVRSSMDIGEYEREGDRENEREMEGRALRLGLPLLHAALGLGEVAHR
jgi:hypothetical protein